MHGNPPSKISTNKFCVLNSLWKDHFLAMVAPLRKGRDEKKLNGLPVWVLQNFDQVAIPVKGNQKVVVPKTWVTHCCHLSRLAFRDELKFFNSDWMFIMTYK